MPPDSYAYLFVQKGALYMKNFFTGFFWPFFWLETRVASLGLIVALMLIVGAASVAASALTPHLFQEGSSFAQSDATEGDPGSAPYDPECNVIGLELYGCIDTFTPATHSSDTYAYNTCDSITSSDDVQTILERAGAENQWKGVLVEIDSPGGSPVAGEEIAQGLKLLGKPSVAWIRGQGDSAAYWAATGASTIVASANSGVGSIGVTTSYSDSVKKDQQDGLTFHQLSSGIFKDAGNPGKPLTEAEQALFMRDVEITAQNFIQAVATNRHLSVAKVTALADGSDMLGAAAKENGLIDEIGTKAEAMQALQGLIGAKPNVCWVGPTH